MVDACGRFCSQPTSDMPELLVSLCYYSDHGRLIVGVERGSFPHKDGETTRTPDTFVKIVAQAEYGSEIGKQKTETVKGSTEPRYDYSASFQIPQHELETTSIVLQVWTWIGVLRRKSQIGWFALGLNSSSSDAQEHWSQMIQYDAPAGPNMAELEARVARLKLDMEKRAVFDQKLLKHAGEVIAEHRAARLRVKSYKSTAAAIREEAAKIFFGNHDDTPPTKEG
ncbi:unnamed protein product, partial [Mesorhabditis spiculigera]